MGEYFPVATEKKARKIIDKGGDVVFIHTRENCPICDTFLPNWLYKKRSYNSCPLKNQ